MSLFGPSAFSVSNPVVDTDAVTLYAPWTRPLPHLGLEIVVLVLSCVTFVHAIRAERSGDVRPLFTWWTIFVYGILMEILSYNFIQNFTHAQFTVMFYGRKLPLYITAVYPVLLYTGITTARRFGLPSWAEGFVAGLLIVLLDVPFDITGPFAHFWRWSATDPLLLHRWNGVPVTSYYWHLAFGGVLAALTTAMAPHVDAPRKYVLALPAALITIVLGVILFLPVHGLRAIGVSHGIPLGVLLGASALVLVLSPKRLATEPDNWMFAVPVVFYAFHAVVGGQQVPGAHLPVLAIAIAVGMAATVLAHKATLARLRGR